MDISLTLRVSDVIFFFFWGGGGPCEFFTRGVEVKKIRNK